MTRIQFQKFASRLSWLGVALLLACSSATGPSGLGGGSGDGGGGMTTGGGPVGGGGPGGNAADTVSMPAPASIARVPTDFLEVFKIVCQNIPGPQVRCYGDEDSAPPGSQLRLSVHPPGNLGTINIGLPVMVTVKTDTPASHLNGSWEGFVTASAGQMIQICLMKAGVCAESLFMTVPPEGGEVNGVQGIKRKLVIDHNGYIFYIQREIIPAKKPWSLTSLFISEANAIEPIGDVLGPGALGPAGGVPIPPEHPLIGARMVGADYALVAADCPAQPVVISPVVEARGSEFEGMEATIWQQNAIDALARFARRVAVIPNASRFEVNDLATVQFNKADGTQADYLATAVHNFVYLHRYTDFSSTLETRIDFPFQVSQLVEAPPYLYVMLSPKPGGPKPEYPVYKIYQNISGELQVYCVPASETLSNLKSIVQVDASYNMLAGIGLTEGGRYSLFVGVTEPLIDFRDFAPIALREYDHSVEVKLLGVTDSGIGGVVLDPTEKILSFFTYAWEVGADGHASYVAHFHDTSLADLHLNYPNLLAIDLTNKTLAFLDIQETGSKIYTYRYEGRGHEFTLRRLGSSTYNIGVDAPSFIKWIDGAWSYNDAGGNIRKVQTVAPLLLDEDVVAPAGGDIRRDIRPGGALPGGGFIH